MGVTNRHSGTCIDEVADGIFRIHTPVTGVPGGFSFNQYLVRDEAPLLFHTGPRGMMPLVVEAIGSVMPIGGLRWIGFSFDRPARALSDGEELVLGAHRVRWLDTPHLPHAWECGYLMEAQTQTLFCGDLFTQPGADAPALTTGDILGPSEQFREAMDYYSHTKNARALLTRLAALAPRTLACMHGSAWQGDGAALLGALADALA